MIPLQYFGGFAPLVVVIYLEDDANDISVGQKILFCLTNSAGFKRGTEKLGQVNEMHK